MPATKAVIGKWDMSIIAEEKNASTMQQKTDAKGAINAGIGMMTMMMKIQDTTTNKTDVSTTAQKVVATEARSVGTDMMKGTKREVKMMARKTQDTATSKRHVDTTTQRADATEVATVGTDMRKMRRRDIDLF